MNITNFIILFQFMHEIFLIKDSFLGFTELIRSLWDQLEMARAEKEVGEELR